ncbi:hypothetical protein BV22DRAFT_1030856 [Leucogyrophana mollusca]|uniref:Uncharacterized protein n=1 Tax=Leucogyrophana mollusca TaxID=85980 RepID=A0ACB8BR03_9AGAM|nr:hypothetical protein BV22DRAFT_1030856 [Leucogyrophana mollusca]
MGHRRAGTTKHSLHRRITDPVGSYTWMRSGPLYIDSRQVVILFGAYSIRQPSHYPHSLGLVPHVGRSLTVTDSFDRVRLYDGDKGGAHGVAAAVLASCWVHYLVAISLGSRQI